MLGNSKLLQVSSLDTDAGHYTNGDTTQVWAHSAVVVPITSFLWAKLNLYIHGSDLEINH